MQLFQTRTIREIALAVPATKKVLEDFKIDQSRHSSKLFKDACKCAGASPDEVQARLSELINEETNKAESSAILSSNTLGELVSYILENHHTYTKRELLQLTELAGEIESGFGKDHGEIGEIRRILLNFADDMGAHMLKEEIVLFPYIVELETKVANLIPRRKPHFGSIENPIGVMTADHDRIESLLKMLRRATDDYRAGSEACSQMKNLFERLEELESDITDHKTLEDQMLFPRAIELDREADRISD